MSVITDNLKTVSEIGKYTAATIEYAGLSACTFLSRGSAALKQCLAAVALPVGRAVSKPFVIIGIDLGTSCSVIACDNAVRTFISSNAGYPKDAAFRKIRQTDIVFGNEALHNRLSLNICSPIEKGIIKYSDSNA